MSSGPFQPKVSVVVASYNRASLLTQAVRSALGQGGDEIEVVVSDDCSPDDSVARLREIGDPRLRLNVQPKNMGLWLNWTAALGMARGEYVVFLGDDDFLSEGFVDCHLRAFERNPQLSAVFSLLEDLPVDGSPSRFYQPRIPVGALSRGADVIEGLLDGNLFFGAAMFRREAAQKYWKETQRDDLVADWGMILGLATAPDVWVTACEGCRYIKRSHPVSASSKYMEISRLISEVSGRFVGRCDEPRGRKKLLDRAVMEKVTLSRHFAAHGDMAGCRQVLTSLLRMGTLRKTVLTQWVQAFLMPGRVMRTARAQRGLVSQSPVG